MDKSEINQKKYPAKAALVWGGLALLLVAVLVFAALLRATWRSARPLDPAGYEIALPENFHYTAETFLEGGAYQVRGWAVLEGERIDSINCWVVLYDAEAGEYLRLPTMAELDAAAEEALGGGMMYARGGYSALVPEGQLAKTPAAYELCFAYRNNANNLLIHTGQPGLGGAA